MMPTTKTRNAFYHGWFAARARRPPPPPATEEEAIFLAMGFIEGQKSAGKPLELLSKPKGHARAALNIDPEMTIASPPPERTRLQTPATDKLVAENPPLMREPAVAKVVPGESVTSERQKPKLPEKTPQLQLPKRNPFGGAPARRRFHG